MSPSRYFNRDGFWLSFHQDHLCVWKTISDHHGSTVKFHFSSHGETRDRFWNTTSVCGKRTSWCQPYWKVHPEHEQCVQKVSGRYWKELAIISATCVLRFEYFCFTQHGVQSIWTYVHLEASVQHSYRFHTECTWGLCIIRSVHESPQAKTWCDFKNSYERESTAARTPKSSSWMHLSPHCTHCQGRLGTL